MAQCAAFIDALAALIDEALRPDAGDPVFQGALQEYRHPVVVNTWNCAARKPPTSASCTAINTVAHPAAAAPGARRGTRIWRGCTPRFLRDHGNRRRRPRKRC